MKYTKKFNQLKKAFFFMLMILVFASCTNQNTASDKECKKLDDMPLIGKHDLKLTSDIISPEVLWAFGRLGDIQLSPSSKKVLYGVSYYDVPQNKSNRELFLMNIDGSDKKQLTKTAGGEYNAVWLDEETIAYLSAESGSMQVWTMKTDGSMKTQISDVHEGISGFKFSPDHSKIAYISDVAVEKPMKNLYEGLDKASGRIMNDLMYRHWDQWVDHYQHIFIASFDGKTLKGAKDIMQGEAWESPIRPFGGMEQINWSPNNTELAYTCRKLKGKAYTLSTNSDIYIYNTTDETTINLTKGMMGYDKNPVYSPDGEMIAWESMERDGYEADKVRLYVKDFTSGALVDLSNGFDQNVHGLTFSADSKEIWFISDQHATDEIYQLTLKGNKIRKITEGVHNYTSFALADGAIIATRVSMSKPAEIYSVNPENGEATEISFENKHLLDQLTLAKVTKRWVKTTDNKEMLVWVILPPNFDESKKYPALLYCQGGPQGTVSQFWSYRWNFQMMASGGYVVVAPNRRGLPGFGQEWNEQISGDYGGQNMKDYFSAINTVKQEKWVDEDRLGAVGASYGGFSVFWLAGHHDGLFKAFIAHDGMFNFESQYLETEEMWFVNWDLGGAFWDKNNKIAQRSYANSPHRFVDKWDTPILIIHGEKDYRIAYTQGMSAFNAAVLRDVPAEFLFFPDENHWVLKPQNGILWQRTFREWLDRWLQEDE